MGSRNFFGDKNRKNKKNVRHYAGGGGVGRTAAQTNQDNEVYSGDNPFDLIIMLNRLYEKGKITSENYLMNMEELEKYEDPSVKGKWSIKCGCCPWFCRIQYNF